MTLSAARYVAAGDAWVGGLNGALAAQAGAVFRAANTRAAYAGADESGQNAARFPWVVNETNGSIVVKRERCQLGFAVLTERAYYNKIDGVQPPGWNGDWFKVLTGVGVRVSGSVPNSPPPDAGRPFLTHSWLSPWWLPDCDYDEYSEGFCALPGLTEFAYKKTGGWKKEPEWSQWFPDWKYPALDDLSTPEGQASRALRCRTGNWQ